MTHLSSEKYKIWQKSRQLLMMIYEITEVFSTTNSVCLSQRLQNKAVTMLANLLKCLDSPQNDKMPGYYNLSLHDILDLESSIQKAFECHLIKNLDYQHLARELQTIESGLKGLMGDPVQFLSAFTPQFSRISE
jgi:four helix bundle protein